MGNFMFIPLNVTLLLILLQQYFVVAEDAKVSKIQLCDPNTYYPVIVDNVVGEERNGKIFISGSLSTDNKLVSPISASLTVKRYVKWMKIWFPVLCIEGVGSCTYSDLCSYGVSQNKTCPDQFVKNNVPCRCPVFEGTYTMEPDQKMYLFTVPNKVHLLHSGFETPLTDGTYWIQVEVMNDKELLSCYQFYVDYHNDITDFESNKVVLNLL